MSVRSARYNLFSLRNPKGLTVIPEERDAWAFLDAAKITSSREQRAVIGLVRGLKNAQLWSKMKAIYPFVGGTATTHKFNLKDPRDADAAYRLSFSGGWTHASTGATPNGTNSYANTFVKPSTNLSLNSTHVSYYSRSNAAELKIDFAAYDSNNSILLYLFSRVPTDNEAAFRAYRWNTAESRVAVTDSAKYFVLNRNSSTVESLFIHNVKTDKTYDSEKLPTINIFLGAGNVNNTANFFSTKQCAFATIGDGLTDTDATALYNIVQRYQTSLGRQV